MSVSPIHFSSASQAVLQRAREISQARGDQSTGAPHIVLALVETRADYPILDALLAFAGVKNEEARLYFEAICQPDAPSQSWRADENYDASAQFLLERASMEKRDFLRAIEPQHLLLGALVPSKKSTTFAVANQLGLELRAQRAKLRELTAPKAKFGPLHPLSLLSENAKNALERAHLLARSSGCGHIGSGHILLALLENEAIAESLENAGYDVLEMQNATRAQIVSDGHLWTPVPQFSLAAKAVLERAKIQSSDENPTQPKAKINARHLFVGCLLPDNLEVSSLASGHQNDDAAGAVLRHLEPQKLRKLFDPLADARGFRELSNTAIRLDWLGMIVGILWWPLVILAFRALPESQSENGWLFWLTGGATVGVVVASLFASAWGQRLWKDRFASVIIGWFACAAIAVVFAIFAGILS